MSVEHTRMMQNSLGAIFFVATIVGFWLLAWFGNRHADRRNHTSPALRKAVQKALAIARTDLTSDETANAWHEVLRQSRELNNDLESGKALLVLSAVSSQRKDFPQSISYADSAIELLRKAKARELLASVLFTKAIAAEKLSRDEDARRALEEALKLYRDLRDWGGELDALNQLGASYQRAGNYIEAEKFHNLALELARETRDRASEARALHNLGTLANQSGRHEDGLSLLQQSLEIKGEIPDASIVDTLNNIGAIHNQVGDVDLAEQMWSKALAQSRESGKPSAIVLGNIAEHKLASGEWTEALELRKQALQIRQDAGDQPAVAGELAQIGGIYLGIGEIEQARDYCEQSRKIAESLQNNRLQSTGLQNLSSYYSRIGDLNQAEQMCERALVLCRESGDRRNEIVALNNLGSYAHLRGELKKSEAFLMGALRLAEELRDFNLRASVLSSLGLLKKDVGEPRAGLSLVMQSAEMRSSARDRRHECIPLGNAASIEVDIGEIDSALNHASRAIALAKQTANRESEAISTLIVAGAHRDRGHLDEAADLARQATTIAEKAQSVRTRLWAHKSTGVIFTYLGDFDSAIQELSQALNGARRHGFHLLEAMILADLSAAEIGRGDADAGTELAESALKMAEGMGSKIVIGNAWHCIGMAQQQRKQYDSSLVAFGHSLAVREALEHRRGIAETHRKLAEVQFALGNRAKARENYRKSLDGFRFLGNEAFATQVESDMQRFHL